MPTTGFFDLPYELQLQIYEQLLPTDLMITYDSRVWSAERTFQAACKADKRLGRGMFQVSRQYCGARIVISPRTCITPAMLAKCDLGFATKRKLEIYIDHYDYDKPNESLLDMDAKMTALVTKLNEYDGLNWLWVSLKDNGFETKRVRYGDPYWCRHIGICKYGSERNVLATAAITDGAPVVEYLLWPLLGLPECKLVIITKLKGLARISFGAGFDRRYMINLQDGLWMWLHGIRKENKAFYDCWARLKAIRRRARRWGRPFSEWRDDISGIGKREERFFDEDVMEDKGGWDYCDD